MRPVEVEARPRPAPFSIWRRMVIAEACQAEMDLNEAERAGSPFPRTEGYDFARRVDEVRREITDARAAAQSQWPDGFFRRWGHARSEIFRIWSGSESETAFSALHRAEGLLLMVIPDAAVRSEALKIESIFGDNHDIPLSDPRHGVYCHLFDRLGGPKPRTALAAVPAERSPVDLADRIMLREVRRQQNECWEIARSRIRIFRNILTGTIPLLTIVLIVIAVVGWADPHLITLRKDGPDGTDLALVEGLGAFGGLLSAVASVQSLKNFQRFYGLPLAQTILKLPAGAATALAGMILLQHGLLGITAVDWGLVVPYAMAFGIAQIAVTRRIDSRASDLLGDANSKSPGSAQTMSSSPSNVDLG